MAKEYIERGALIKNIKKHKVAIVFKSGLVSEDEVKEAMLIQGEQVQKAIEETPTADVVEVKHGYWINHLDDLFPAESTLECSVCHEEENITLCNDNFCPNCGAKMDRKDK